MRWGSVRCIMSLMETTKTCFVCGGQTEDIDGLDVCVEDCMEPDDDEDFESYRDEKLREHEDWFRGER